MESNANQSLVFIAWAIRSSVDWAVHTNPKNVIAAESRVFRIVACISGFPKIKHYLRNYG